MVEVIKRSGKRQRFSKARVQRAVEISAKEARVAPAKRRAMANEIADSVAQSLKGKRSVRAADLRRRVLGRLERRSRAAAKAWRRHDRKRR